MKERIRGDEERVRGLERSHRMRSLRKENTKGIKANTRSGQSRRGCRGKRGFGSSLLIFHTDISLLCSLAIFILLSLPYLTLTSTLPPPSFISSTYLLHLNLMSLSFSLNFCLCLVFLAGRGVRCEVRIR